MTCSNSTKSSKFLSVSKCTTCKPHICIKLPKRKHVSQQTEVINCDKYSQTSTTKSNERSSQTSCTYNYSNGVHYVPEFLGNFWEFLKVNNQNNDFMSLALRLMENQINKDNIAWLSALHRGRYSNCTTTCSMKYDSEYVEFFSLFFILFGASALNILQGPGHFGSVLSKHN